MERKRLESLSEDELQQEAIRLGLESLSNRNKCLNRIISYLERNPPFLDLMGSRNPPPPPANTSTTTVNPLNINPQVQFSTLNPPSTSEGSILQICSLMLEQTKQQKALMQQMFTAMNLNNNIQATSPAVAMSHQISIARASTQDQMSSTASACKAQPVNLLSSYLPDFSGTDDEDIESWSMKEWLKFMVPPTKSCWQQQRRYHQIL
ncbi:uncharacterized protein LOC118645270 [Monomorium pharaonis]|uniref:uncharacterized protein LOC118645270 n=1 Tax=Monomorium pharaonis TaxID=307658 RepID=UPI00174737B5|nr:uncharacterized protein LOC118645270 [Monomorium pharaonis]